MKVNREIFETLEKVAQANPLEVKMAAAIVRRGKIVSIGMNSMKSHPLARRFWRNESAIFLHAEVAAIKNALREIDVDDLRKTDIYICRIKRPRPRSKNWVWGLAMPCEGCQRAIDEFGIKRVIYTTDEHGTYEEI